MAKLAIAAAALALAAAAPATAQRVAVDWSSQVANIAGEEGTRFSVESAGAYGCELTFSADGTKPDLVFYKIPDATSVLTILAPEEWLAIEDGTMFNLLTVADNGEGVATISINVQAFSRVADPNLGPVLRSQNGEFDQSKLLRAFYINFSEGSEDEDKPILEWEFPIEDATAASVYFDECLGWIRTRPEWQADYGTIVPAQQE